MERKIDELAPENQALAREFMRVRRIRGVQDASLRSYVIWLRLFDRRTRKPFHEVGAADVLDFLEDLRNETEEHSPYSGSSVAQAGTLLKTFFRWLLRDELRPGSFWDAFIVRWSIQRRNIVPLTREEKEKLLLHCRTFRDRVMVFLFAETGFRRSEMASLNVESVTFDEASPGAWIQLPPDATGLKRGPRRVFILDRDGDLERYLTAHPRRHEPQAPLFPTFTRRSPKGRLSPNGITMLLRHLHHRAEIRPVNPHLFRHTRATKAARNNWNESRMRLFFGWTGWSRMPSLYTHLNPDLIRDQVLRDEGFVEASGNGPGPPPSVESSKLAAALSNVIRESLATTQPLSAAEQHQGLDSRDRTAQWGGESPRSRLGPVSREHFCRTTV
ncbi:MAG: site-specific integrase [Euryarchaeota archaeon]|nr:site-specific integrase [Euryarchaeota archaeon]